MQETYQGSPNRQTRFHYRLFIGFAILIIALSFAFYRGLPNKLAQQMILKSLINAGVHNTHIGEFSITKDEIQIHNLSFAVGPEGHQVTVPEIVAHYHLSDLYHGTLQTLAIRNSRIIIQPTPETLPPIESIITELAAAFKKFENIQTLAIENTELQINIPEHPITLQVHLKQKEDQTLKSYLLSITSSLFALEGHITNQYSSLIANLDFKEIKVNLEPIKFASPALHLNFEHSYTNTSLKLKGNGQIQQLETPSYGQLVTPIMFDMNLQHFNHTLSGSLEARLALEKSSDFIKITPDLNLNNVIGELHLEANISPNKLWTSEKLASLFVPNVTKIAGQLTMQGSFKWSGNWLTPETSLKIGLQDLATTIDDVHVTGLNSTLSLSSLYPFVTAQPQSLKADKIEHNNLILTNLNAMFSTSDQGTLKFHSLKANVFTGEVSLHTFQPLGKALEEGFSFHADCSNIDLNELIKFSEIVGLKAEAKLVGEGEFKYSPRGFEVIKANLRSISPEGKLHYQVPKKNGDSTTNQAAEIAIKALEDLHFTLLEVNVLPNESTPENDIQATIKILGFNPKVLSGYPFEFNIQTTGQLGDLMRNALKNLAPIRNLDDINKMVINQ
jgi:hypothetical protein